LINIFNTDNFLANLDEIEDYWDTCLFPTGHHRLLHELTHTVLEHLQYHPRLGRNFLQKKTESLTARHQVQQLEQMLAKLDKGTPIEIREYVMTDYLLLYALAGEVIYLLAIKHQKQLAFAFSPNIRQG
jgi:hypothetical protein